jgi:hypothetical protein
LRNCKFLFLPLLFGVILSFFIRQPYIGECAISNEGITNICIADNYAKGLGFTLSIKENYYPDTPVAHFSPGECGIVYPIILSFFIGKIVQFQWINLFFAFLTSLFFFMILKKVFDEKIAWISFIWLIFHPRVNVLASYVLNVHLLLFIVVFACWVLVTIQDRWGKLLAGAILGFTFWAEPWFLFAPLAFLPGIFFSQDKKKEGLISSGIFTGAFVLVCIPLLFIINNIYGAPFPPKFSLFLQTISYNNEYLYQSYNFNLPGSAAFIFSNLPLIITGVINNFLNILKVSFISDKTWLILLCIPAILLADSGAIKNFPKNYLPLLSFSVMTLLGTSMLWSIHAGNKNSVFILIFLVPALLYFLPGIKLKGFPIGQVCLVLIMAFILNSYVFLNHNDIKSSVEAKNIQSSLIACTQDEEYLVAQNNPKMVVAATDPWRVYFLTKRDCGLLPINIPAEDLKSFLKKYGYNYIFCNSNNSETFIGNSKPDQFQWLEKTGESLWKVRDSGEEE